MRVHNVHICNLQALKARILWLIFRSNDVGRSGIIIVDVIGAQLAKALMLISLAIRLNAAIVMHDGRSDG